MKIEKQVLHPIHPWHNLNLSHTDTPFNCAGCHEAGIGFNYQCLQCDFTLHKLCAMAPPKITHPFYPKCAFDFFFSPPGAAARFCDACRNDVSGFVYHCKRCGFDLHPCCANLPQVLDDGEHDLYLSMKLSGPCHRCGGRGPGWSYKSKCRSYNLHLSCVKELLVESWQAMYLKVDKNKVIEVQTRIPSLKGTCQSHPRGRGKVEQGFLMASRAVRCIVSAMLGDPTAMIAAVVGSLISK
ncbi:hypothetical protein SDJN02_26742, partial [Cucurbita argyrosperma subsp. argyrosperma]